MVLLERMHELNFHCETAVPDPPNKEGKMALGNESWQEGQEAIAKETKASSWQRQIDATKTLVVAKKRQLATLNKSTLTKLIHH